MKKMPEPCSGSWGGVKDSRVYCFASEDNRPLKEFIIELREELQGKLKCQFGTRQAGDKAYGIWPDAADLFSDIGYRPAITFKEGISDVIKAVRDRQ